MTPTPRDEGMSCGHAQLLLLDFANQPRPLDGACLFCERDQLKAENEALRKERGEMVKALRKYGWHDIKTCNATNTNGVRFTDEECTCGFDAALSAAGEAKPCGCIPPKFCAECA